jgi:hypothetical protein
LERGPDGSSTVLVLRGVTLRIRSLLALAASVTAAFACAAPAQAAAGGTTAADAGIYLLRDLRTGACLTPQGGDVGPALCGPGSEWQVRVEPGGAVRFADAAAPERCLAVSPLLVFPPMVWADRCDGGFTPSTWQVLERAPGEVSIAAVPDGGSYRFLTVEPGSPRATLGNDPAPRWQLVPLG